MQSLLGFVQSLAQNGRLSERWQRAVMINLAFETERFRSAPQILQTIPRARIKMSIACLWQDVLNR